MQPQTSAHNEYWGVDVEGGISLFTEEWPWEWGRGLPLGIKEWALFLWRALLLFWSFLQLIDSIQTFLLPTRPAKASCLWDVHSPVSPSALAPFSTVTPEKGCEPAHQPKALERSVRGRHLWVDMWGTHTYSERHDFHLEIDYRCTVLWILTNAFAPKTAVPPFQKLLSCFFPVCLLPHPLRSLSVLPI